MTTNLNRKPLVLLLEQQPPSKYLQHLTQQHLELQLAQQPLQHHKQHLKLPPQLLLESEVHRTVVLLILYRRVLVGGDH